MISLCKTDREKMTDASVRWPIGALALTKNGQLGLVTSEPFVSIKGKPCFSLLLDGSQVDVTIDDLKKERRKKVK